MNYLSHTKQVSSLFLAIVLLLLCIPFTSFAATSTPTCELLITTSNGKLKSDQSAKPTVLLPKGEEIVVAWKSKNAKEAFWGKKEVELSGSATSTPTKSFSRTYTFENGSKKAVCALKVIVASGSFADESLVDPSLKPTIEGEASGVKTVQLIITQEGKEKAVFASKALKVKNGEWSVKLTKALKKGKYTVELFGEKDIELNLLATDTLYVGGAKPPQTSTTFVAESVPLLVGGTTKAGATVPISYLQLINIGKESGKIEGFTIKQNGNASTKAIVGFTISDTSSPLVTTVGSVSKPLEFVNGIATVTMPPITVAAGQMKLFTIKAILAPTVLADIGKQLKLDVASYKTSGAEKGALPIRGVTWTLGL